MNTGWTSKSTVQLKKANKENNMTFILWHLAAIISVMAISFILGWIGATKIYSLTEK
jgi:hypothetical protein